MNKFITVLFAFVILIPLMAVANDAPIEVLADEALEWDRVNRTVVARGNAVVTQADSHIKAPSITALYSQDGDAMTIETVTAQPDAVLTRPSEVLNARMLEADFNDGILSTVTATDQVVLKTENETLYGDRAVYDAQKRIIIVTGNVRIEQDQNILTGTRAEFDLNTNISRLSSDGTQQGGRVRAVFGGGGQ